MKWLTHEGRAGSGLFDIVKRFRFSEGRQCSNPYMMTTSKGSQV
jgi:hypothetical protein